MPQKNLGPRILVQGGLDKTGAILDGDEKTEYVNASFVRLNFKKVKLQHVVSFDKEKVYGDDASIEEPFNSNQKKLVDDWIALHKGIVPSGLAEHVIRSERFIGEAEIEKSRFGKFELSLFGSSQKFTKLSVSIHRAPRDIACIGGTKGHTDENVKDSAGFFCDIQLNEESFDEITKLYIYGQHTELNVRIDISNAPGFYAAWSPAIDEGRVVKFLNSVSDLENPEDLPKHFNHGGGYFSLPFNISVNTPEYSDTLHDSETIKSTDLETPEFESEYPDPQTHEMNNKFSSDEIEKKVWGELSNIRNAVLFVGILIVVAILY